MDHCIAVIDFGSQTTQLIARRIRELGVYALVFSHKVSVQELQKHKIIGIILSGGPETLAHEDSPRVSLDIINLDIPKLGICYGMQVLVEHMGGQIKKGEVSEFGVQEIKINKKSQLFHNLDNKLTVWMSHFDHVESKKNNFEITASTLSCPVISIENQDKKIYGVQFHPEVSHTKMGAEILGNFIFGICQAHKNFDLEDLINKKIAEIKNLVGSKHVIMGLSGGVDSSVAAVLISRALGEKLHCVYVNHGLHRAGEIDEIKNLFENYLKTNFSIIDAQEQFFSALEKVTDPEIKRKKIGHVFIKIFEQEAERIGNINFLGQGTLYPDIIESECQSGGPSHVIKSHHNVGGLPEHMKLKLVEPLRDLFKDEVRKVGELLGLNKKIIHRQPFPGPGLAVRIPGEVTKERAILLRQVDQIVCEEIECAQRKNQISPTLWQWFAILLPVRSVGVKGDARVYGASIVIRVVESVDAMTADWAKIPHEILEKISLRITNQVLGVTRVLYDITQKPPGTIEWE